LKIIKYLRVFVLKLKSRTIVRHELEGVVSVDKRPVISFEGMAKYVRFKQRRNFDAFFNELDEGWLKQERKGIAVLVINAVVNNEIDRLHLVCFERDLNGLLLLHLAVNKVSHLVENWVFRRERADSSVIHYLSHYTRLERKNLDDVCPVKFHKRPEKQARIWLQSHELNDLVW